MLYPYALQLYSVREHFERDPAEAAAAVAAAGYGFVELAGCYGRAPETLRQVLAAEGLRAISMHVAYDEIIGNTPAVAEAARVFGLRHVVVPWLGPEICTGKAAWTGAARAMDAAGAALREAGLRLSYHNHDQEFRCAEGECIFDLIFDNSAPENLAIQLDTGWAAIAGADVPALLLRHAGRIATIHVKDFTPSATGGPPVITELGRGIMDWQAILPAARASGAQWFVVEQDSSEMGSMNSAAVNAVFMRQCNGQDPQ